MQNGQVKFYFLNDISCGWYFPRVESILLNFDPNKKVINYDISDILELYNIQKFIDNGVLLRSWSSQDISKIKDIVKQFRKIIAQYFNFRISDSNFDEKYVSLDYEYQSDFL